MNSEVIDPATFAELQDAAGADFVRELVDTFLEEAPGLLAELRGARLDGDADRFRRAAHSLKSNGQTFGATALGAMARALELNGLDTESSRDLAAIDALDAAYSRTAAALQALRDG